MPGRFKDFARWLLIAAVVVAPWAYGGTRPWAWWAVEGIVLAAGIAWIIDAFMRRRWPQLPKVLVIGGLWLIAQGWWMALNASQFNPMTAAALDHHPGGWLTFVPGGVDRSSAATAAFRISALIIAMALACDLGQRQLWRYRVWGAMALTGASIALLGLVERVTGAEGVFWAGGTTERQWFAEGRFFGTFEYHANAGSFLNLIFPLVVGGVMMTFQRGKSGVVRTIWVLSLAFCLAAIFINTSRAANFLGALLVLTTLAWFVTGVIRGWWRVANRAATIVSVFLLLIMVGGVVTTIGLDSQLWRWANIGRDLTSNNLRLQAAKVSFHILPNAGLLGFGPGSFPIVFAAQLERETERPTGQWRFAHEDYLQTVIEWGWIGAMVALIICFGAVVHSILARYRSKGNWSQRDLVMQTMTLLGLASVALHAAADYPLQILSIQLYVAVALGLLWSSSRWLNTKPSLMTAPGEFLQAPPRHRAPHRESPSGGGSGVSF